VKYQRKEHRKAHVRKRRELLRLNDISPAPAFSAYHRHLIEKTKAEMTGFQFQPRKRG
jgi:hypothetical protein